MPPAGAKPSAMLLRLRNVPRLRALRLEEALFRTDKRSWLITSEWDDPAAAKNEAAAAAAHEAAQAVVLGISGKPREMVHEDIIAEAGVPLIKRFTGGGTVICDADTLFVTFIAAAEALPEIAPYPEPILEWTSHIYSDALERCGVDGFRVNANDYCLGELKFGGNAQSISGKRWLHHTSLLWDYQPERMEMLKQPPKQPDYRRNRPHGDFVRGLRSAFATAGHDREGRSALMEAIVSSTAERFELEPVSQAEAEQATALPHRKVTRFLHGDGGKWNATRKLHEAREMGQRPEFGC